MLAAAVHRQGPRVLPAGAHVPRRAPAAADARLARPSARPRDLRLRAQQPLALRRGPGSRPLESHPLARPQLQLEQGKWKRRQGQVRRGPARGVGRARRQGRQVSSP